MKKKKSNPEVAIDFLGHVVTGSAMFAVMALAAVALSRFVAWLPFAHGDDEMVIGLLRMVEKRHTHRRHDVLRMVAGLQHLQGRQGTQQGLKMHPLLRTFLKACAETPRGYFAPAIALWNLFRETADRKQTQTN